MEKVEFIAKAKSVGISDSEINEYLDRYASLEAEGKAPPLDIVFSGGIISPDEIDNLLTDSMVFA